MFWIDRLEAEKDLEKYLQKITGIKPKNQLSIDVSININPALNQLKCLQSEILKTCSMAERLTLGAR